VYILKRAALSLLGVAVMLAYWTFTGSGSNTSSTRGIPARIGPGDGGTLAIEVTSTTPARFSITFDKKDRTEEFWAPVTPGTHPWAIDIPKDSGGRIELDAENPKVDDTLSWKIRLNGEKVEEQSETLDKPLTSGYAFFLQSYYDDYSTMKVEED
jgi:hypothetical protein